MTEERSIEFASKHRQSNFVVVQAIIALSNDDRPPETIWRTPRAGEWQTGVSCPTHRLARQYSSGAICRHLPGDASPSLIEAPIRVRDKSVW